MRVCRPSRRGARRLNVLPNVYENALDNGVLAIATAALVIVGELLAGLIRFTLDLRLLLGQRPATAYVNAEREAPVPPRMRRIP